MSPRPRNKQDFNQAVTVSQAAPASTTAAKPATAGPVSGKPSVHLYFVNAFVDYGFIGLASIITCLAMFLLYGREEVAAVMAISTWLLWVVNHPHFMATNYRLYHSKENIMQYPITALVVPWIILAFAIGALFSKDFIAPLFIKVLMIWSPYHFSGQTLGITLIYARRAGFYVGKWERFTLSNFIYGTFLVNTARGETAANAAELPTLAIYEVEQLRLGLPAWVWQSLYAWMVINGLVFLVLVARWSITNRRLLPPIVLLPSIAQFVWFILGPKVGTFYYFVPMFHSLQYLLIAWSMQLKEKMDQKQIRPSLNYVATESARWGVITLVAGGVFFFGVPFVVDALIGQQLNVKNSYGYVYGIITAAIQIHHFFVDGVIWKLKRKTVSSPLMVNIDDLIHGPAQVKMA